MEQITGIREELVEEFVEHLERRGRGSYTRPVPIGSGCRTSRVGRNARGVELDMVLRCDVEAYVGEFAAGPGRASRVAGVFDLVTGEPGPCAPCLADGQPPPECARARSSRS